MSKPLIEVRNLSKRYDLGESRSHDMLREKISHAFSRLFDRKAVAQIKPREFWALKDVSFDVSEGEVLGVIGRNGAGKSTLLKILSSITEPTAGEVRLRGRVASLLEVGTGFHKELTGRENVYLNGAILGMSRAEIRQKFDEIVQFSGVEKFIDTPVKRYSSGMTVRLAFAVAAHLDPEILLIDEVLAVGDSDFQKRCIGKMNEVVRRGRTILFVSHNMAAVENLCQRAILLNQGQLLLSGTIDEVIDAYNSSAAPTNNTDVSAHPRRISGAEAVFQRFDMRAARERTQWQVRVGDAAEFVLDVQLEPRHRDVVVTFHLYNPLGQRVTTAQTNYQSQIALQGPGRIRVSFLASNLDLMPGLYNVVISACTSSTQIDRIEPVATIEVLPCDLFGSGNIPKAKDGVYVVRGAWAVSEAPDDESLLAERA